MASLYLIRHAEPAITGVMLGQLDPPLSRAGQEQAEAAFVSLKVDTVWTSPLRRAVQTAVHIQAARLVELSALRELDQGEWSGKTWTEIEAGWAPWAARKQVDWLATAAPGGEAWPDFLSRVQTAWDRIRSGPSPAAIVAHQAVNAALAYLVDGRNPLQFHQHYGEITRLVYD